MKGVAVAASSGHTGDGAVRDATGRDLDEWYSWLHEHGADELDHRAIVELLRTDADVTSGWWQQQLTVRFEQHVGRRRPGETEDGTFQIGVQRSFRSSTARTWQLLASEAGATAWLGEAPSEWWHGSHGGPVAGDVLTTPSGQRYEVRSVSEGTRIRLRTLGPYVPLTTIQLTLTPEHGRTVVGLHQEGLPEEPLRETMREHWRRALDRIGTLLDEA